MSSSIENNNLDEINFDKEEINTKKDLYLNCLNYSNPLHYLEKEDIINFSKCSKSTYKYISEKNLLLFNLIYHNQS